MHTRYLSQTHNLLLEVWLEQGFAGPAGLPKGPSNR
jgi:O-antigen ligase